VSYKPVTIEDATATLIDYRGKTPPKSDHGVKLITAKVIKGGYIQNGKHEFILEETYDDWMRRGLPQQWDILITTEAPLGEVAQIRTPEKIALAQRVILLRGNPEVFNQQYYFQCLKSDYVQGGLKARATGTTVLGIKQSELRKVHLPWYPIPVQERIASILSAYDDLIENNERRIAILEEMARNLYREWFVEFRFPDHEKVKMIESDLGPIPEGWEVKQMQEVASVIDCLHSKKPSASEDGTKVLLQLFNIIHSGLLDTSKQYLISDSDYEKWTSRIEASEGDCVVTNVGRIAAVGQVPAGFTAALGRNMTGIRPTQIPPSYLIQYLLSDHMKREVRMKTDSGVIMDALNVKSIKILSVPIPPPKLMEGFTSTANGIRRSMEVLLSKNSNLRTTRDLLLPKLISGELDVSDLDIEIPEAVA
jgi:type I restriction enzyme S subunit